jgi:TolB protein
VKGCLAALALVAVVAVAAAALALRAADKALGCTPKYVQPNVGESRWSRDGRQIAFELTRGDSTDVWRVSAAGGAPRLAVRGAYEPAWAPGGRVLAFVSGGGYGRTDGIATARVDGSDRRLLTHGGTEYEDEGPTWSPDGRRIAFIRGPRIFSVSSAGGTPVELYRQRTYDESLFDLAWRRDGSLSFVRGNHLLVLHPGGRIERGPAGPEGVWPGGAYGELWAPDGRRRVELVGGGGESCQGDSGDVITHSDLLLAGPDGRRRLAETADDEAYPSWSPDGRRLAFARGFPGERPSQLWVIGVDGRGARQLTRFPPG